MLAILSSVKNIAVLWFTDDLFSVRMCCSGTYSRNFTKHSRDSFFGTRLAELNTLGQKTTLEVDQQKKIDSRIVFVRSRVSNTSDRSYGRKYYTIFIVMPCSKLAIMSPEKAMRILKFNVIIAVKRDVDRRLAAMSCWRRRPARGDECRRPAGTERLHENLFIRYRATHQCLGTGGLEIAGGRGAADAPVDTGHCSLPNINSVYGNRILLFNRTIEVRAGAISHGDASAAGRRERWRTTAMPSRLRVPLHSASEELS